MHSGVGMGAVCTAMCNVDAGCRALAAVQGIGQVGHRWPWNLAHLATKYLSTPGQGGKAGQQGDESSKIISSKN